MSKRDMNLNGARKGMTGIKFNTCSFRRERITVIIGSFGADGPMMTDFTIGLGTIALNTGSLSITAGTYNLLVAPVTA